MTPWKKRADEIRYNAEKIAIASLPGYNARQERSAYLELAFEGRRWDKRAHEELKFVKAAGDAAVDKWSDSEESEMLINCINVNS